MPPPLPLPLEVVLLPVPLVRFPTHTYSKESTSAVVTQAPVAVVAVAPVVVAQARRRRLQRKVSKAAMLLPSTPRAWGPPYLCRRDQCRRDRYRRVLGARLRCSTAAEGSSRRRSRCPSCPCHLCHGQALHKCSPMVPPPRQSPFALLFHRAPAPAEPPPAALAAVAAVIATMAWIAVVVATFHLRC